MSDTLILPNFCPVIRIFYKTLRSEIHVVEWAKSNGSNPVGFLSSAPETPP